MLNVLIVGCGNIAGGFDVDRTGQQMPLTHAGAFVRHGGFNLAACVEPDENRREAFKQRWSVGKAYAQLADVLEDPAAGSFDVISLCSPTAAHAPHLKAALALKPRLVFCEKPVTPTVQQTAQLLQQCEQAGVPLAVNHTRRWAPDVQRLARELADGQWGAVRSAVGTYNKGVLNNGSHMIDLLHLLLGPLKLLQSGKAVHDHWIDDPSIPALLQTDCGIPVHLNTAHSADCAIFELQLFTERAVICMEDGGLMWRVRRVTGSPHFQGYRVFDSGERSQGEYLKAIQAAVDNLQRHLLTGEDLASTGTSALAAQRVCEDIRQQARQAVCV